MQPPTSHSSLPWYVCVCAQEYSLVVYCLARKRSSPAHWQLEEHTLSCNSADQAREWVTAINNAVSLCADRWVGGG